MLNIDIYYKSYYNSDIDDGINLDLAAESICGLVNSTANAIYNQASGNSTHQPISANCTLVASMLDCLIYNFSCPFMQNYFNGKKKKKEYNHS